MIMRMARAQVLLSLGLLCLCVCMGLPGARAAPALAVKLNHGVLTEALLTPSQASVDVAVDADAVAAFWTADRLKGALAFVGDSPGAGVPKLKPLVLVQTTPPADTTAAPDGDSAPTGSNDAGAPDAEPTAEDTLLFNATVDEEDAGSQREARSGGSMGGYYSSTQLVPYTADELYPYRTVGKLYFTIPYGTGSPKAPGSGYWCSASVIQRRLVVTAGGCLHSGKNGQAGWFTNFYFVPATRYGSAPYGVWAWTGRATTSFQWYGGGGSYPNLADFGLVMINYNSNGARLGSVVGWLGWGSNLLAGNVLHQLGYAPNLDSGLKMHSVYTYPFRIVSYSNYEFATPMTGVSGAPLIQNFGYASAGEASGWYRTGRNTIAGVTSYYYISSTALASGTSSFAASSAFQSMWNYACSWASDNCA